MNISIVIPDDYQCATSGLACLRETPGFSISRLGDLRRDPAAAEVLHAAQALILIRERTVIDDAFLARTPALRLISQTGKIAGHLDLDACTRHGVAVVEGEGSPVAAAELTWLLIMAARRRLVSSVDAMRAGRWQTSLGEGMAGRTLGVLGFGKIGKRVARYAEAFDMRIQVWGSERAREEARRAGYRVPDDRADFFTSSDVVTVHLRLVPETAASITAADLRAMSPEALFVNTSRAGLVEPGALLQALRRGRPSLAAIDVFEQEPLLDPEDPLLLQPNLLCTPHIGYVEKAGYEQYFGSAFDNVARFFAGDTAHVLNRQALV
jgi:D-3-phosphoglycerate dehydrogenase / 2-oxoglutarate reductase